MKTKGLFALGRIAAVVIAAIWMLGGTAFYIMRYSTLIYYSNQSAFDSFLKKFM